MNTKKHFYICKLDQIKEDKIFDGTYTINTCVSFVIISDAYVSYNEAAEALDELVEKKISDYEYKLMNMSDDFEIEVLVNSAYEAMHYIYRIFEL